jgi:excinuclease ABC C subunit
MTLRKPDDVPAVPGSYQFIDTAGRVIYVGKAANLRNRVANYFADPATLHPRIAAMVAAAQRVEWITVDTEVEALMLEYNLIKRHRPRFNVRLRDDKSYPYLAVTLDDRWPRAGVMRGRQRKGTKYFGPYAQAWAIRDSLDAVLRQFPVRTCSDTKFRQHERLGRPCLLFHIEKCSGPCVAAVDADTYAGHVDGLVDFLSGDVEPVVEALTSKMEAAARDLDFETAATCRDRLGAIDRVLERQVMVGDFDENFDVLAVVAEDGAAGYNVFHVRKGRVRARLAAQHPRRGRADRTRVADAVVVGAARIGRDGPRPAARCQAGPARHGAPQRPRTHRSRAQSPGRRPQRPQQGIERIARHSRTARGTVAHRVLRHGASPRHRLRGVDGGARGRFAGQEGVPHVQREDGRRQ